MKDDGQGIVRKRIALDESELHPLANAGVVGANV